MTGTYLDVLAETRRVIVSGRFGVTESFKYRVGGQNLSFDFAGLVKRRLGLGLAFGGGRVDGGEITHDEFGLGVDEHQH